MRVATGLCYILPSRSPRPNALAWRPAALRPPPAAQPACRGPAARPAAASRRPYRHRETGPGDVPEGSAGGASGNSGGPGPAQASWLTSPPVSAGGALYTRTHTHAPSPAPSQTDYPRGPEQSGRDRSKEAEKRRSGGRATPAAARRPRPLCSNPARPPDPRPYRRGLRSPRTLSPATHPLAGGAGVATGTRNLGKFGGPRSDYNPRASTARPKLRPLPANAPLRDRLCQEVVQCDAIPLFVSLKSVRPLCVSCSGSLPSWVPCALVSAGICICLLKASWGTMFHLFASLSL